jgi:Sporulation and spore germination
LTAKPTPSESPSVQESPDRNKTNSTTKTATQKAINVTLYTSDNQCQNLVPKEVSVPSEEPLKGAVGKIIEERDNADFSLSGYRVSVKNGVATVDLRVSPESKRQLTSLSSCEQFALFGSLKKTLTSNPKWNVKDVRFTEKGEELAL